MRKIPAVSGLRRDRELCGESVERTIRIGTLLSRVLVVLLLIAGSAAAQTNFITFESGPVRPLAKSPDGTKLFAVNTPDAQLEVFDIDGAGNLSHSASVQVGLEPVAVAARTNSEVWVVNHLSDSVSIVDLSGAQPIVTRTLLVGDEPRDIVFAGTGGDRAFITTAHRGQHRTDSSINSVTGSGDPQLTTEGIGRADVWVFDAASLGNTLGGTPTEILTFFADTPRALAVSPDGATVYVAAFHSGNQTTVIGEGAVCDGFDGAGPCNQDGATAPGGVPGPDDNDGGAGAPEVGVIVRFDGDDWRDADTKIWNDHVRFDLPDHDVFSINANTLAGGSVANFDHVGTILFNMVVNPVTGKVYVTNTEAPNHVRFEGAGDHGGSTVQGHLSETRISVLNPTGTTVDPQHLNQHIDYSRLHTDTPDIVDTTAKNHSLATPLEMVVTSDGQTIYMAAFGSAKIGVFSAAAIEDGSFEANFDPTVESANYITTGGGPSGLVLNEGDNRLYVLTRFDNSVATIDLGTGATVQTLVLNNPEPASVIDGRPFLYDAFLTSGNGETSCASCHIFADFDSLAWNLGDPDGGVTVNSQPAVIGGTNSFHPMKGPMTTQTLRGMATHGALHWRGDRVDGFFGLDPCNTGSGAPCDEDFSFNNFIVAFEGLVGLDGTISVPEMQQFTDFALQIQMPPNPVRALDNSFNSDEQAGFNKFFAAGTDAGVLSCDDCHTLDTGEGFFGTDGRQTFEGETQNFKVPHMRNMYQKIGMFGLSAGGSHTGEQVRGVGFLHDGTVDTLFSFFSSSVFQLTNGEQSDLEALSLAFDSDLAPVVGQQVTLTSANQAAVEPRVTLLIQRAGAAFSSLILGGTVTECDLIAKVVESGVEKGFLLEGSTFTPDDGGSAISDTALRNKAKVDGNPVTYTCVPPGSGHRMALDRDQDTLLNGVETNTGTFVNPGSTGTNPGVADTDGDGFDDGDEVIQGTDPNDPLSFPGALVPTLSVEAIWLLSGLLALLGTLLIAARRHTIRA